MGTEAFQITSLTIVYSTVWSDADQRKHQSSVLLAFVRGIHRWPVNSPHIWPVTRKMLPFDDVIMTLITAIYFVTVCHHERAIAIPEIHPNIQYSSCSINPFLHMYFEIFIGDALIPLCSGQNRNNRTTKIWYGQRNVCDIWVTRRRGVELASQNIYLFKNEWWMYFLYSKLHKQHICGVSNWFPCGARCRGLTYCLLNPPVVHVLEILFWTTVGPFGKRFHCFCLYLCMYNHIHVCVLITRDVLIPYLVAFSRLKCVHRFSITVVLTLSIIHNLSI